MSLKYTGYGLSLFLRKNKITYNADSELKAQTAHINDKGNYVELLYFLGGDTSYFIEGEYYALSPSDIVFSNPTEIHGIVHSSPCTYKRLCIAVCPDFFMINNLENLYQVFSNKYPGEGNYISRESDLGKLLKPLFEQILEYMPDADSMGHQISSIVIEIVKIIASDITHFHGEVSNPLLRKVISYIIDNYNKDIGLNSIAEEFYINRTHLARIFKQLTKCSVHQFITILRFNRIYQFRYYSKMSLVDAVRAVGYKNYSTFYRAYKRYYGCAPGKNDEWHLEEHMDLDDL